MLAYSYALRHFNLLLKLLPGTFFSQTEPKRLKIDKQGEDLGPMKSKQTLATTSRSVTAQEALCRDVAAAKSKPPVNMSYTVSKQYLGNYF